MSVTMQSLGIDRLGREERLALAHEILESVQAEETGVADISDASAAELGRRLAAHRANPGAAKSWEEIEARANARFAK